MDPKHFTRDDDSAWWCVDDTHGVEVRVDGDEHGPRAASLAVIERALRDSGALLAAAIHHLACFLDRARYLDDGWQLDTLSAGLGPAERTNEMCAVLSHEGDTYGRFTVVFVDDGARHTAVRFERRSV